tara:strand:- start:456 stop:644 length:189 start_codon:yes stop_codon:yes gene_type:complete
MKKHENKKTFNYYEEIPHMKVEENALPTYIYKRLDTEVNNNVEYKSYYLGMPVPKSTYAKGL